MERCSFLVRANEKYRENNYSGAIHRVLLEKVILEGGYVCVPIYDKDMGTHYICTNCISDLDKMLLPMIVYVEESAIMDEIQEKLQSGNCVFFVGLPCQVKRMGEAFRDSTGLLCMQFPCKGVMPQEVFNKYLEQFDREIKTIQLYDDKKYFVYDDNINIVFEDGIYFRQFKNKNTLLLSLSKGMSIAEKCMDCGKNCDSEYADYVIGDICDFSQWEYIDENYMVNDKLGTSCVVICSEKGLQLFEQIKSLCQTIVEIDANTMHKLIFIGGSFFDLDKRNRFLHLLSLDSYDFDKAYEYALHGRYDIAINGDWTDYNYGSVLTAVALYWVVEYMGFSAIMVQYGIRPTYNSKTLFSMTGNRIWEGIEVSSKYNNAVDCEIIDWKSDIYLLGSDINWRSDYMFTGTYLAEYFGYQKKKIAYSTSISEPYYMGTSVERKKAGAWIHDFAGVSVREKSAVDICKDDFGIDAVHVLDPVMLIDVDKYIALFSEVKLDLPDRYLVFYKAQVDPYHEQYKCAQYIAEKYGLPIIVIENPANDQGKDKKHYTVEEFIYLIRNAEYFVGGSFHGTCFSLLFHIPFSIVANPIRGSERIKSIAEDFGVEDRVTYGYDVNLLMQSNIGKDIDWDRIDEHLQARKDFSYNWLKEQLYSNINEESLPAIYMSRMARRIRELEEKVKSGKQEVVKRYLHHHLKDSAKVIIRGAGSETRELMPLIEEVFSEKNINMLAVVDGNVANAVEYQGRLVYAVSSSQTDIYAQCDSILVISSRHHKQMVHNLLEAGVCDEKIIDFSEFLSMI